MHPKIIESKAPEHNTTCRLKREMLLFGKQHETIGIVKLKQVLRRPDHADWAIITLHGSMSHAGWFSALGNALATNQIACYPLNRRGCGENPDTSGYEDPAVWINDVHNLSSELRKKHKHVAILGWCWGARLALVAQEAGANADRLILAAPGLSLSQTLQDRFKKMMSERTDDSAPISLPFDELDFSDRLDVQEFIRCDSFKRPTHSRAFMEASRKFLERAIAVNIDQWPTLTILATDDAIVDNEILEEHLKDTEIRVIEGGHGLILESPQLIASEIACWLDAPK